MLISGAGSPSVSDITDVLGAYTLSGFGAGSYTVTPSKTNGSSFITSFDCARIAQYITGNISFTAAQVTVADVTGNGDISSFDAALIARYILALGAPMGLSGDWIFSPVSRNYPSVTGSVSGEDYVALKMGEVSGNWEDPGNRPAESNGTERRTAVTAPHLVAVPGSELTIPITVQGAADKGIVAYQFDLRYDPSVIHPQADAAVLTDTASRALTAVVNAEQPGLLRVVVYGAMPITSNGVLLNLKFTAVGQVGSISPLTWEQMMFNEGDPMTTVSNGQIELSYAIGD